MYDDTLESGENNFTKFFMQLLCPSCCGGLFSETKGSVYTKRKSTARKSEKSATVTVCSEMDAGSVKNEPTLTPIAEAEVATQVEAEVGTEVGTEATTQPTTEAPHQMHLPIPEEEIPKDSVVRGEKKSDSPPVEGRDEPRTFVALPLKEPNERKLVRDTTVEEDMNVLSTRGVLHKSRSMSLSQTINDIIHEELDQNMQQQQHNGNDEDDNVDEDDATNTAKWYNNKLRKTSFPNTDGNCQPRNDQTIGLKIAGKEYVEIKKQDDENEPPFNFQAVLRKTNSTRQSLRRYSDLSGLYNDEQNDFMTELFPGIILRGMVYDL